MTGLEDRPMATATISQTSNTLLGTCALTYRWLTLAELEKLLVAAGKYLGKNWTQRDLQPALQPLLEQGLVEHEGGRYRCSPQIADDVCCLQLQERSFSKLAAATRLAKLYPGALHRGYGVSGNADELYRAFRMAIFEGEVEQARQLTHMGQMLHREEDFRLRMAFHLNRFEMLPAESARELAAAALEECHFSCSFFESALKWLRANATHSYTLYSLSLLDFLRGEQAWGEFASLEAIESALAGRQKEALKKFAQAAEVLGRQPIPFLLPNTVWVILLLAEGKHQQAQDIAERYARYDPEGQLLVWLCRAVKGLTHELPPNFGPLASTTLMVYYTCLYWAGFDKALERNLDALLDWEGGSRRRGFDFVADQLADLARAARREAPSLPWLKLYQPLQPWQRSLTALQRLTFTALEVSERLVWVLEENKGRVSAQPKVQKIKRNGSWSPGRVADIYALMRDRPAFLDRHDYDSLGKISLACWGYRSRDPVPLEVLQDHPRVFWEYDLETQVEVVQGKPELTLRKDERGITLELATAYSPGSARTVTLETPQRLRVITWEDQHQQLAEALGAEEVTFPPGQEESLNEVLRRLSSLVSIDSNTPLDGGLVQADSRLWLEFAPYREGLQLEVYVKPLGPNGPSLRPAQGGQLIAGDGRQAQRDIESENQNLARLKEVCPELPPQLSWCIEDTLDCLEQLAALALLPKENFVVSWPRGRSLRLRGSKPIESISLQASQERDWLALTGELQVDEELVVTFQQLLRASEQARGRFIPLGEGEFLELTESFRRRLATLARLGSANNRAVKLPSLAAAIALREEEVNGAELWQKTRRRLESQSREPIELPSGLNARLRDYQKTGFEWLSRLAQLGLGACLADDMGLGKTVQTLACLLTLAERGPALVVAPTSVCANWADEAARFAPQLRVHQLGQERQQTVASLGPQDVLVVSYGLLVREEELLQSIEWTAVVLDEAQAIKNSRTQRARAVYRLQAEFRLALSGTPVENHLQELWSLFRFLNPGLLGSLKQFKGRLAHPIEKEQDLRAAETLKSLVSPFLLRRTKKEVLKELPPRTDITVKVEMSEREQAFYESLRRQAVDKLSRKSELTPIGILAELTRLRQAACNPRLIDPESRLPSAKLETLEQLLDDLRGGGHRALVFSQFVGHLTLVRQLLESRGISYQYLDGSTSAAQRRQSVEAFQGGEGELFLISLKAGGTGLNLTEADYVVHLDPWWNPAVEDQASDRAHRIGQQKPVTVYRLVAAATIEEKILALHQEKRELADQILSQAGSGVGLSAEELMQLLLTD